MKSRCKSVNIKRRHAIEPKNLEKLIVWEKRKEKDSSKAKITPQEEKIMVSLDDGQRTLQFKANLSNSAQRRGSKLADRSSQLESYEHNSNKKFYVEQHKVRLMKPSIESFRQRAFNKQGMVSNASIITLKLEEENVNPDADKNFAYRLKSLSSKTKLMIDNMQTSDISPSHSVKGKRFKGNFKLALSKQKKTFYRSYYDKVNQGHELSEDMKKTFEEFKKIEKSEGNKAKEKEQMNEPLGIFNTNASFQNPQRCQGTDSTRPSSSQDMYRFNFRRKLINQLIKKIATSDDEEELDDPYELKDQLRRYQTENSIQSSPHARQPLGFKEFTPFPKPKVQNVFEKQREQSISESIKELPLSTVNLAEDYETVQKKIENNSPGDSPSRLEEKYNISTVQEKSVNRMNQTRRTKLVYPTGKSPERKSFFPKQAAVLYGNRYIRKKQAEIQSRVWAYNSDLNEPVLKVKKEYSLRTQSAAQKTEITTYRSQEPERNSFTTQHSTRRHYPKESVKIVQRPVVFKPRNDTAGLLTLFLQQRKMSMERGEQQGRRVMPLGASRIGNCLKISNLRRNTICEYKM